MGIRFRVLFQEKSQWEPKAADGHRETFSLPGERNCSKWVNQNVAREDVNAEGGEGKSKRSRNLTAKGLAYKCNIFRERSRIIGRLIRKYATIEDLLFSTRNLVAVQEEMGQFNDLFRMLLSAHEKYNARVPNSDSWFVFHDLFSSFHESLFSKN